MHDICIIGDKDSVLGFKALGYTIYAVEDAFEAERVFERVADEHAVIFIVEEYAEQIKSSIDKYREKKLPAVIPVPGSAGAKGLGISIIRDAMERAVGADILFKDE
jgi:V/A-type H+/Na+-transporting ATPase subunit F